MGGQILVVAKYDSGRAEDLNLRDKANPGGPRRSTAVVRQVILTATDPMTVTEWLPDGQTASSWKPQFTRGQKVVCVVSKLESRNGLPSLAGKLEALT